MTLRKIAIAVTALGLSLATTGCASWIVIKQAEPNPFADLPSIGVVPLSFERCKVGERTEEDYTLSLNGARLKAWTEAKEAMVQSFFGQLKRRVVGFSVTTDLEGESYRVVSRITFIEPGADAGEAVQSSEVRMNASIVDKKGEVLDEIILKVKVSSALSEAAVIGRLKDAAAQLGETVASYLMERVL